MAHREDQDLLGREHLRQRLEWMVALRWKVIPAFVLVDLLTGFLAGRSFPWLLVLVGIAALAANALVGRRVVALAEDEHALQRLLGIQPLLPIIALTAAIYVHAGPLDEMRSVAVIFAAAAATVYPSRLQAFLAGAVMPALFVVGDLAWFRFDLHHIGTADALRWLGELGIYTASALAFEDLHGRRERAEQELRHALARLAHADKMAAVGVLAAGIAHEVNNPAGFVSANLRELRRYVDSYESALSRLLAARACRRCDPQSEMIEADPEFQLARQEAPAAITESLEGMSRLSEIVGNLRSLARKESHDDLPVPIPLAEVVETVVKTAHPQVRGTSIDVDVGAPITVLGHRGQLVQVLLNLVVNAVQASDPARPNRVAVRVSAEPRHAIVAVSDTGTGMPAEVQRRIFEPFFTTKAPGQGTGLGLSLAREIVSAHGGSIEVESRPREGSTFTVRLPRADA